MSQLTIVIGKLRDELQKVAKAIARTEMGLPANLDTHLTGAG